jgi:hypothetical protein
MYVVSWAGVALSLWRLATCWLDGPWIESQWWLCFPHQSRPVLASLQPPVKWIWVSSPVAKRPGRGFDHSPPSSAEVTKRVELYLQAPSGP